MKNVILFEEFGINEYERNRNILKQYIKTLLPQYEIPVSYFTIMHNFLILEEMFKDKIPSDKKLIGILDLKKLSTKEDIYKKFMELYDPESGLRNRFEKFNEIDILIDYKNVDIIFKKVCTKIEIETQLNVDKFNI